MTFWIIGITAFEIESPPRYRITLHFAFANRTMTMEVQNAQYTTLIDPKRPKVEAEHFLDLHHLNDPCIRMAFFINIKTYFSSANAKVMHSVGLVR